MSHQEHRAKGPFVVGCFVLTVSDTRTPDTDTSGQAIRAMLEEAGHVVTGSTIVRDEPADVARAVRDGLDTPDTRVVISTGGTGITARDGTFEAVNELFEKRLDGFGELFRMLSYQEIGPAAMLTRACAGLVARRIVIALPGSPAAVRLAMEKLIIPELGHLVQQASK